MRTDLSPRVGRAILFTCAMLFGVFFVFPWALEIFSAQDSMARNPHMLPALWAVKEVPPSSDEFNAVKLSGTFTATSGQFGNFEIMMHGADLYYLHRWHRGLGRGSYFTELMLTNRSFDLGIRIGPYGSGGGGGGGSTDYQIYPARRLWNGNTFVGANPGGQPAKADQRLAKETEEFRDEKKVGPFSIPCRIIHRHWDERVFTYSIDKIEFAHEAQPNFYFDIRDRDFRHRFD